MFVDSAEDDDHDTTKSRDREERWNSDESWWMCLRDYIWKVNYTWLFGIMVLSWGSWKTVTTILNSPTLWFMILAVINIAVRFHSFTHIVWQGQQLEEINVHGEKGIKKIVLKRPKTDSLKDAKRDHWWSSYISWLTQREERRARHEFCEEKQSLCVSLLILE